MPAKPDTITLTAPELQDMLETAAETGATRALRAVGLHDEEAAGDVRDLRGLLDAYRAVKDTALRTVTKALIIAVISATAAAVGLKLAGKE